MDFAETYGPWAIIAGASEGVGSAFATAVAERGVNVLLLSRRQAVLDDVAARSRRRRCRGPHAGRRPRRTTATDQIVAATSGLDVGLLDVLRGRRPSSTTSSTVRSTTRLSLVQRNCIVPCGCAPLRAADGGEGTRWDHRRELHGRDGWRRHMAAYGGSKAFDIVFTESLWASCTPRGSTS